MTHESIFSLLPGFARSFVLGVTVIIAFAPAVAQQARKITKVEFVGLQRLKPEDVTAAAGIKAGDRFSLPELDAAAQKLANSGLFSKVGYRTRTTGTQIVVVFQVEEIKGGVSPVVFDNFVWFTNEELQAAIKREIPSFDGTAPDAGNMADTIKTALQNFLNEQKIGGTVEYAPWHVNGGKQEHLYSVAGVPIPICALHFPGSKNVPEEKLLRNSKQLTEADFSQKNAIAFGTFILFPLYREAGQLRARFGTPVAKYLTGGNCKGVDLTIPVTEGPIYLWDGATWNGNEALPAEDLDSALGMKKGDVANGVKIDKGFFKVREAYGRKGHLQAAVDGQPVFSDAASRVGYQMAVKEGPQFKMGTLTIKGVDEADRAALEEKWQLKYGAVLDTGYLETFFNRDARDVVQRITLARQGPGREPRIDHKIEPKLQTLTGDVIIEFKY